MKRNANESVKMKPRNLKNFPLSIYLVVYICNFHVILATHEDCPWYQNDAEVPNDIKSHCICATNPSSNNQLSIQCQDVDAQELISALTEFNSEPNLPIELLYLNGSRVTDSNGMVPSRFFRGIKMISLQISSSNIKGIHPEAFSGIEAHLKHLSLSQNQLTTVPIESLSILNKLTLLDLSYNRITKVLPNSFEKLSKLATLKLNDNNIELESGSLSGLETSLRNLNLKGTRISAIPDAISALNSLAFLDLAQNRLRDLELGQFSGLHSLTALNLERNLLQSLPSAVFNGVNDTLSSLSLLNNLITHFPKDALKTLRELRVLDLGFNLLTEIPQDAFDGLSTLTLLALDGNPLATLSKRSFITLNSTLRGISIGGRFLNCDCRIRWLLDWIREFDLQVTSRERNPQFCGNPSSLQQFDFYQLKPEDLQCKKNDTAQGDYDVDLLPEDIALLGTDIGSPSDKIFKNVKPQKDFGSDEDNASEQETDENRNTFTLEIPDMQQEKNFTRPRNRFRRPRPTKGPRYPSYTENSKIFEEKDSLENNAEEDNSSNDSQNHEILASEKELETNITSNASISTQFKTFSSTTSIPIFKSTTRKLPLSIRSHNIRPKIQNKLTTTTTSISSTARASNQQLEKEVIRPKFSTTTSRPTTSRSTSFNPVKMVDRMQSSKTISSVDIDDPNIPVISGIGSSLSNLNSGSVIAVKPPIPVQTNIGTIVKPQDALTQHPLTSDHGSAGRPPNLIFAERNSDILLHEIERNGETISLQWESSKHSSSNGFRIIYRLFGEDTFRHGPPLASTEREYRIKGVPNNECLVICVVPYDDILYNEINPSAASVPPGSQCRELKPNSPSALMNNMDKITIGASAAICATVLIAVMIFIAITKRAKSKRPTSALMAKIPPNSFMTPSPGPIQATTPGPYGMSKEWDQMSVISTKSIPRARVFHGSLDGLANVTTSPRVCAPHHVHRQGPEGHTHSMHRSYLSTHHHHHNHSMHGYHHNGNAQIHSHSNAATGVNSYLNNQNRLLRTSLGSRDELNRVASHAQNNRQQFEQNQKRKRPGRLSQSESINTLNGYETPDNWTDHDMDFYVARNPTRHDLVQL